MNLIELSNNLKDVPDHYLMNEVQQPTGAYPAYLVISELTRRKGMRDRALKNDPKSTVVEDLTQPNREQMMSAVAQMQQPAPQQQPLPPQMPMPPQMPPQIPQMPAAGLMATPQASSLAATDAMASPRKHMASGGLVAFNEGGDVKRFNGQTGSDVVGPLSFEELPDPPLSAYSMLGDPRRRDPRTGAMLTKRDYEMMLAQDRSAGLQTPVTPSPAQAIPGNYMPQQKANEAAIAAATAKANAALGAKTPVADQAAKVDVPPPPYSLQADLESKPFSLPAARGGAGTNFLKELRGIKFPVAPTAAEEAATAKSGEERYAAAVPNRLESVEKELGSRTQNLKDRRKSALNEALMMAGIGVLKSKSPGRYFGEGAEEGMLAYRQSMKDVRGGEDLMTQARQDLAKAQILQDQGKFEAGQKMLERGIQKEQLAVSRINLESQNAAQIANAGIANQGNAIQSRRVDIEAGLAPYAALGNIARANLYSARGINAGISDADQKAAETAAFRELMSVGMAEGTPGYAQAYEDAYRRHLQRRMPGSVPGQPAQVPVRGEAQGAR
jgi:hypothetical protein